MLSWSILKQLLPECKTLKHPVSFYFLQDQRLDTDLITQKHVLNIFGALSLTLGLDNNLKTLCLFTRKLLVLREEEKHNMVCFLGI